MSDGLEERVEEVSTKLSEVESFALASYASFSSEILAEAWFSSFGSRAPSSFFLSQRVRVRYLSVGCVCHLERLR